MKSRIAMMAMLVLGLLMSGTGAGLAVSGLSSSGDASVAQYGNAVPCDLNGDGVADATEDLNGPAPGCASQDVLPTNTQGGSTCDENGDGVISPSEALKNGCGGVQGETEEGSAPAPNVDNDEAPAKRESGAQPTRQVEADGGGELPFTGFAAIPILVGGIALLSGGRVLRRRTAE